MKIDLRPLLLALLLASPSLPPAAAARSEKKAREASLSVERWLVLGPVAQPLPEFGQDASGAYGLTEMLADQALPAHEMRPAEGREVGWFSDEPLRWRAARTGSRGTTALSAPAGAGGRPVAAWLAAWLTTDRWVALKLEVLGEHPRRAWLDGESVAQGGVKSKTSEETAGAGKVAGDIELIPGKHLLLLETIFDPARGVPWFAGARLVAPEKGPAASVSVSLDPERDLRISDVTDMPHVTSLSIAPFGTAQALSFEGIVPGTHRKETWIEIRSKAAAPEIWRGASSARQVAWSLDGKRVAYVADDPADGETTSTLYVRSREAGTVTPVLRDVKELQDYLWSPTGKTIAYWTKTKAKPDERGVKRLQGLLDRQAGFRDRQYLSLVTIPGGVTRRITAGELSTRAWEFSPDGGRLLFSREVEDLTEQPYTRIELWELELPAFVSRKLRDFRWLVDAAYAPDGRRLALVTRPDEFGGVGRNLPEGVLANSYDGELFLWDPASGDVQAISRDFDPAVTKASWSLDTARIYLTAAEQDRVRVYRYDVEAKSFDLVDTGFDVTTSFVPSGRGGVGLAAGSSPWRAEGLVWVDLERGRSTPVDHPADSWLDGVRRGEVRDWSFTTAAGRIIEGRVYLPPAFDPRRAYPCIVYYYAGMQPTDRGFGGRYPKEWWAANGYVVYVPQPSGAIGFGQEFSAAHVNDWGKTTSEEILEGTRRFLDAHPFVDRARVGCIGASYGGFMTMLLATKTDLFAAAVAHAGISSIASYWGEGYWGYSYGAVANAGSFPWNRPDIFVQQSPLFRADKTRVPILLTHGLSDPNVPVGESDAFYVALKLLGRPVEYVQVEGQEHWILDHAKRQLWSSTIVAWFDRWLKGQPEWWNDLYPPGS